MTPADSSLMLHKRSSIGDGQGHGGQCCSPHSSVVEVKKGFSINCGGLLRKWSFIQ
jgi:hypothetical protein